MRLRIALILWLTGLFKASASLLDGSFDIGSGADGLVEQVLQLPDGKVLICGNFTTFNGQDRGYIARLNNNGSVDMSFRAQPGYWVRHMSLQSDGKIVIGGYFTTVEGQPRNLIARLNPDGSLDSSFNPGAGAEVIIAGGIDGNVTPFVFWTEIQADGKILITGNFRNFNGESSTGLARLNADGSRDSSFQVGQAFDSWGRFIKALPNGQILVSGWFTSYNGQNANRLVRINSDGSRDQGFNPFYGDRTAIYTVAVGPDGKYITAGDSINEEGLFRRNIEKINDDGSVDPSWVGQSSDKTESALMLSDGSVVVGGYFTLLNGISRPSLGRFLPDGTVDPNFAITADNFIWTVAAAGSDKILISGGFTTIDGQSRRGVARLNLSGVSVQPDPKPEPPKPEPPPEPETNPAPVPHLVNIHLEQGAVAFTILSSVGRTYIVQARNATSGPWRTLATMKASRPFLTFTDGSPTNPSFYRVQAK